MNLDISTSLSDHWPHPHPQPGLPGVSSHPDFATASPSGDPDSSPHLCHSGVSPVHVARTSQTSHVDGGGGGERGGSPASQTRFSKTRHQGEIDDILCYMYVFFEKNTLPTVHCQLSISTQPPEMIKNIANLAACIHKMKTCSATSKNCSHVENCLYNVHLYFLSIAKNVVKS